MFNYDFPLSPKARTYLKFEQIFSGVESCGSLNSIHEVLCLLRGIVDYIDLVDGSGAIKIDLQKDLEKCDSNLKQWITDPNVDAEFVTALREQISKARLALNTFTRQRTVLQTDPIIESIKPRFLAPCGVNCFDTPLFEYWIHQDVAVKQESVQRWKHELECLRLPTCTVLYIWRLCADYQKRVAKQGFMQENADSCDLINIQYDESIRGYPVVSGFQSRVNIRFLPFEKQAPVGDVEFEIAYIKGSLT
ncbi:MAG: cell division protein ZapD [Succinivibrio sp.]|nr:cell division protein ZapD [Succinivibrio sp.]